MHTPNNWSAEDSNWQAQDTWRVLWRTLALAMLVLFAVWQVTERPDVEEVSMPVAKPTLR